MGLERVKGDWLQVGDPCGYYIGTVMCDCGLNFKQITCGRKCTHAVFLNTPWDSPYIVGICPLHRNMEGGFPFVTIRKLAKVVDRLLDSGVAQEDLAIAVAEELDPHIPPDDDGDEEEVVEAEEEIEEEVKARAA